MKKKYLFVIAIFVIVISIINNDIKDYSSEPLHNSAPPIASEIEFSVEKDCTSHDLVLVSEINATCVNKGTQVYACSICDHSETRSTEKIDHDLKVTEIKATCEKEGKEITSCSYCNHKEEKVLSKLSHDFKELDTEVREDGHLYTIRKCSFCGLDDSHIKETNYKSKYGYMGTLVIPDIGIDVKVCDYKASSGYNQQYLCDKQDCAAYLHCYSKQDLIADHNYQGFERIKKSVPNVTIAYFNNKRYMCINKVTGHNTEYDIVDSDYKNIKYLGGDIVMYTCNGNWRDITITVWQEIV